MPIKVECDSCFYQFSVADKHAGRKGRCPECGESILIPKTISRMSSRAKLSAQLLEDDTDDDDDDDDYESRPSSHSREESNSQKNLLIGLGVGAVTFLLLVVAIQSRGRDVENPAPAGVPPQNDVVNSSNRYAPPQRPTAVPVAPSPSIPGQQTVSQPLPSRFDNRVTGTNNSNNDELFTSSNSPSTPAANGVVPTATSTDNSSNTSAAAQDPSRKKSLVDLVEEIEPSVVRIDVSHPDASEATGSGFIVSQSGLVVTNYHVIEGGASANVVFSNGKTTEVLGFVKLIPEKDIAILKIAGASSLIRSSLKLADKLPRKGESVVACGSPLGLSFTFSEGIISAHRKAEELFGNEKKGTWVQTTTPISPGNSGGPLVNMLGEVVAMNTITIADAQNLNFGISSLDIKLALDSQSQSVTVLSPETVPVRAGHGRSAEGSAEGEIIDVSKEDFGKRLFGQLKDMNILSIRLDYDPEGDLTAYLRRQMEVQCKQLGIEITGSKNNLLIVKMEFDRIGTSKGARAVKMSAMILMAQGGSSVNPRVYQVWERSEDLGTVRASDFAKGKIPDAVRLKTVAFFRDQLGKDYAEAKEFAKNNPANSASPEKTEKQ